MWNRAGLCVGAAVVALGAVAGLWRAAVWAELGLSNEIHVEIEDPEGLLVTVYTPDGDVPDTLPVSVLSEVRPEVLRGGIDVTSVFTALGGELDGGAGTITGERERVEATLINEIGETSEYAAVIDLANLEFDTAVRGSSTVLFASDAIRTVAIADSYYGSRDISGIAEGDEIPVDVEIHDLDDIDSDGNGIPDANALLDTDIILINANGVITIIAALDGSGLRGDTEVEVTHAYESASGPVQVSVLAPTLEALQLADDSFDVFNTARLIMSIAGDAADLVDDPSTADPEAEFDLVDGSDPLPAPRNIFVRTTIAVATIKPRGEDNVAWTFVDDLPGGLDYVGTLSGPGVAEALQSGTDVGAYTYGLTFEQSGANIDAVAGNDAQAEPWAEADSISVNNEESADDEDDARIDQADDGDDTIRATFSIGSAIFGSNVTPRADSGGGGGGGSSWSWCFIATAAYGTPMAGQIDSLRTVRDGYLVNSAIGAAFVDAYSRLSPPVARVIAESEIMKQGVRAALAPVVTASRWFVAAPGTVTAAIIAMMILGAMAAGRAVRPYRIRARR